MRIDSYCIKCDNSQAPFGCAFIRYISVIMQMSKSAIQGEQILEPFGKSDGQGNFLPNMESCTLATAGGVEPSWSTGLCTVRCSLQRASALSHPLDHMR